MPSKVGFYCRGCGKFIVTQGIANHEKKCLPVYTPRTDSPISLSLAEVKSSEEEIAEESIRFEFPKILYQMLEDCTFDEQNSKIISWQPHGLAFRIHNREELEKILPRWFREKYESLRCKLEQWGFLKLSRGKDRGCWYHNKFFYLKPTSKDAKNRYEGVEKAAFVEGMPANFSFRNELDLEKQSTQENRTFPKTRKRPLDLSLERLQASSPRARAQLNAAKFDRYHLSTLKECQYCHEFFAAQGFAFHQRKCAKMKATENGGKKRCRYCDRFFFEKFLKAHQVHCRKIGKRNAVKINLEESEITDDDNGIPCQFCGRLFSKFGVKNHERNCKGATDEDDVEADRRSLPCSNDGREVPCQFCGRLFSKFGVKNHERNCKKRSDNTKSRKDPVVDDDTSVDSVDSGCRICGFDDDHANLLLCEGCDTEVHTYCLTPPLEKVPTGDWFCGSCKFRMGKAEEEFGVLLKNIPPQMAERFGEICFAKSAENAHWWPALIFDPRSFLHNSAVAELARRNLGKRYLVFFFENQDAFAAIPEKWIMKWGEAVEKQYNKGKSVQSASMSSRLQFQRAMDLANEAFEDRTSGDSVSDTMESNSPTDSDNEEASLSPRIPRIIGGSSDISFGTFTDKKPLGRKSRLVAKANSSSKAGSKIDHALQQKPLASPIPQSVSRTAGENLDSLEKKASPRPTPPPTPPPPPLPPLSDHERNELLLKTSFSQYYILPLSQL